MAQKINPAKKNKKKAIFITVEGLEGCGKSSVIRFLQSFFKKNNFKVETYREPGSTQIGRKLRRILLDKRNKEIFSCTELLLYLAARVQLIEEKLKKSLFNSEIVICDRFYDSTLVYQGYALGLGKIAEKAVDIFSLGIKPDLTIFLDTAAEAGLKRLKVKDRIESRPLSFHKKLRRGFLNLAEKEPERIKVVDASGNLSQIYQRVEQLLIKSKKVPIGK